jgi:hypothetical protein
MRQLDWLQEGSFARVTTRPAEQPRARRLDPETSHEAAEKAAGFAARHEAAIFGAIHDSGPRGATAKEIARSTRLTDVQVNRRLGNMGERGLIRRNGEKRDGCMVWVRA